MTLVSKTAAIIVPIAISVLLPHTIGSHATLTSYVLPLAVAMVVVPLAFAVQPQDLGLPQVISYGLSLPAALGVIAFLLGGVWGIRSMTSATFNFAYHLFGVVPSLIAILLLVRNCPRSSMTTALIVTNAAWIGLSVLYALISFAWSGINLR